MKKTRKELNHTHYKKHRDKILASQREKYWLNKTRTFLPDKGDVKEVSALIDQGVNVTELMVYLIANFNQNTRVPAGLKRLRLSAVAEMLGITLHAVTSLQRKIKSLLNR